MPRPANWQPYRTKDGAECPSVTTILGKFRDPGPLMWWSWQQGKDGKDFRASRDAAADAGTLAHALVEADIHGTEYVIPSGTDPGVITRAAKAFENYIEWKGQTRLTPVNPETRLVSEKYRYGGTLDSMLIGGKLAIGDLKTSGAVYTEHLIQVAAYGMLHEENYPDQPLEGGYHILRISRESADFAHHFFGELADAARMFLLLREAYDLDKKLKARVR